MNKVFIFILPFLILSCDWFGSSKFESPHVGYYAPSFELKDRWNKSQKFFKAGTVIVLNFWDTNCEPCRKEMPSLIHLQEKLKKDGLMVIAVSLDSDWKTVQEFLSGNVDSLMVLLDNKHTVAAQYEITGYPETFIIDRRGIVRDKVIGATSWDSDTNIAFLNKILEEK